MTKTLLEAFLGSAGGSGEPEEVAPEYCLLVGDSDSICIRACLGMMEGFGLTDAALASDRLDGK